jgi:hypothetical protein
MFNAVRANTFKNIPNDTYENPCSLSFRQRRNHTRKDSLMRFLLRRNDKNALKLSFILKAFALIGTDSNTIFT